MKAEQQSKRLSIHICQCIKNWITRSVMKNYLRSVESPMVWLNFPLQFPNRWNKLYLRSRVSKVRLYSTIQYQIYIYQILIYVHVQQSQEMYAEGYIPIYVHVQKSQEIHAEGYILGVLLMSSRTKRLKWRRMSCKSGRFLSLSLSRYWRAPSMYSTNVLFRQCSSLSITPESLKQPTTIKQICMYNYHLNNSLHSVHFNLLMCILRYPYAWANVLLAAINSNIWANCTLRTSFFLLRLKFPSFLSMASFKYPTSSSISSLKPKIVIYHTNIYNHACLFIIKTKIFPFKHQTSVRAIFELHDYHRIGVAHTINSLDFLNITIDVIQEIISLNYLNTTGLV